VTTVPGEPEVGVKVKVVNGGAVNDAAPLSPLGKPVTITEYVPLAPDATVNDPDTTPPDTVQIGFEISMGEEGDDEIVQLVSVASKPDPEITTLVPAPPVVGVKVRGAVTLKTADTEPCSTVLFVNVIV
jgi:hypothetical protein